MFRIKLGALAGAIAIAFALGGGARLVAQDVAVETTTGAYFVELSAPVDTFRAQARAAGVDFSERYVFTRLWRGLSVNASSDAIALIATLPSVSAVFPVFTMSVGPTEQATPDLAHALAMTGADVAQSNGWTGAGVRVGVIDTGIDYDHPDLGGGFGPGFRVATGYDFVGDRYDAAGSGGASGDFAAGGARGVAPGVSFGAYRVFGCEGSTDADVMLAAMERALA